MTKNKKDIDYLFKLKFESFELTLQDAPWKMLQITRKKIGYKNRVIFNKLLLEAIVIFSTMFFISFISSAQNVGVNETGAAPDASALLDLSSTDKGFLITRADTANILSPAFGLMTLSPIDSCLYMYSGLAWKSMGGVGINCSCTSMPSTPPSPSDWACGDAILDIDGNSYGTVEIGSQCWMTSNLNVTKFNDGSPIHQEVDNNTWNTYTQPAFCWYDNDATNGDTYGALYNWFVIDKGNVCPTGWHVPTDAEWCQMENAVETDVDPDCNTFGMRGVEVGKNLKASTWDGDNLTGFTGLPSGYRWGGQVPASSNKGAFSSIGSLTQIWTATANGVSPSGFPAALKRNLNSGEGRVFRQRVAKQHGLPIRCVQD